MKTEWRSNVPSPFVLSCTLMRLTGSNSPAAVGVEHVAAHLVDVEPAVAVERDRRRVDDLGVGEHQLQAVAGRQDEAGRLLFRRQRLDGRLRRKVGARIGVRACPACRVPAGGARLLGGAAETARPQPAWPKTAGRNACGWRRTPDETRDPEKDARR